MNQSPDDNRKSAEALSLSAFQQKIAELILECPSPGQHAARSAIRHLERGWAIREIDPEFAALHAITAEEEAARAIFHALQRHRYPNSDRLKWQRHEFKAAVLPFFQAVRHLLADMKDLEVELVIEPVGDREVVRIRTKLLYEGSAVAVYPEPPLHYQLTTDESETPHDFANELRKVASERSVDSIRDHIRSRANLRNRLLYAADQGIPNFKTTLAPYLNARREEVFALLIVYLLIDQHRMRQLFVLQTLDVFLRMMESVSAKAPKSADHQPNLES